MPKIKKKKAQKCIGNSLISLTFMVISSHSFLHEAARSLWSRSWQGDRAVEAFVLGKQQRKCGKD